MAKGVRLRHGTLKHNVSAEAKNMVVMAEHKAFFRSFDALFAEGMALADKVSGYFNTAEAITAIEAWSSAHSPDLVRFYENERKRLGALVMQMAAWLWLERALREGDMRADLVSAEKKKLVFAERVCPGGAVCEKAVREGEIRPVDSANIAENGKNEQAPSLPNYQFYAEQLPRGYCSLAEQVERFIARIRHMDKEAECISADRRAEQVNSVAAQWRALHRNFGKKA